MAVWTISAQAGTAGDRVAAGLAAASGAALLDRASLASLAGRMNCDIGDAEGIEQRFGGLINASALSVAMNAGSVDAFRELQLRRTLPDLGRAIMSEAARRPCVILAAAGFAALREHPSAVHVRLWAPLDWRVRAYARDEIVDRRSAERAVKHDDHVKRTWVRSLYGVDVEDARQFTVALDASRVDQDRIVEILLAAAGVATAQPLLA